MHHVIIGNGGAGVSALQAIRKVDSDSKITIISREKYPAYSPCSLPNLLAGELDEKTIFRFDKSFYKNLNAEFLKNSEAVSITPGKKELLLETGKKIKFDKLLISAGAKPITPQMKGLNLPGVHVMGTLDSALGILKHLEHGAKKAVVVGGGFMGIETAVNLKKRGIDVTIVEMLPDILARMLDKDVAQETAWILKAHSINLVLKDVVKEVRGKDKVTGVTLSKTNIECDMVVVAIGVVPNTELVKGCGVKVNRGIIVDQTMKTNVKDIYAAGDIVEVREQIGGQKGSYAIWPNAIEQGRIAGLNMAGVTTEYAGAEVVNILDVFDVPVIAMGSTTQAIGKCKTITSSTPYSYKKLLIKNNRILGLQFVNTIRNTGPFYGLMKKGTDIKEYKDRILDDNFILAPEEISSPSGGTIKRARS